MPRVISAFKQFFDGSGDPLVSGWLYFTESGTTSTDKNTYADVSEATANANPLQLDAEGRCPNCFGSGSYRVVSYTNDEGSLGVQIQQRDPVGDLVGSGSFSNWNAEFIYSLGDTVETSAGVYYRSLVNNNQGNDPTTSSSEWEQVEFVNYYSSAKTYSQYDRVRDASGCIYVSQTNSNTGNTPSANSVEWVSTMIREYDVAFEFSLDEVCRDSNGALWASVVADNIANAPTTDDGTNWKPVTGNRVIPQSGGGTIVAFYINELQDGNTYTLPAANSLPANTTIMITLPDAYSSYAPVVQRAGSDDITDSEGTDTSVTFDSYTSEAVGFTTDGTSDWRI